MDQVQQNLPGDADVDQVQQNLPGDAGAEKATLKLWGGAGVAYGPFFVYLCKSKHRRKDYET